MESEDREHLGARIKSLRKDRGLTQDQLAEKADLHPKYISSLERGLENPTFEVSKKLAKGLGVSIFHLFITDHEEPDEKKLRASINEMVKEAKGEKLRTAAKLLDAILR